jgi:hypothetical protein
MACQQQLEELEGVGAPNAINAIRKAIANDWQGLFPEKVAIAHSGLKAWASSQEDLDA